MTKQTRPDSGYFSQQGCASSVYDVQLFLAKVGVKPGVLMDVPYHELFENLEVIPLSVILTVGEGLQERAAVGLTATSRR